MKTTPVPSVDHLEQMAHASPGLLIYADTARGVYRLRRGQQWFEAPMEPTAAKEASCTKPA